MNKFEALKLADDNDDSSGKEEEEIDQNGGSDENKEDDSRIEEHKYTFPPAPEVLTSEHKLQYPYCIWFSRRPHGKQPSTANFEDSIKLVGTFSSVEQFWGFYSYMVRPGELIGHSDVHIFKHGIRPMWEDTANKEGGKWIVRLKKGLASRCWENLILAMLGEQFMVGPEVCGAVVSIRYQEDIISIWNRNAGDQATTSRIRDTLRRVLNLPQNTIMEYKAHMDSLNDRSSFRNTNIFVQERPRDLRREHSRE